MDNLGLLCYRQQEFSLNGMGLPTNCCSNGDGSDVWDSSSSDSNNDDSSNGSNTEDGNNVGNEHTQDGNARSDNSYDPDTVCDNTNEQ
jgi:hypothetical protein